MRRTLALLLAAAIAATSLLGLSGPSAQAGVTLSPITGRLMDLTSELPVAGTTVRLLSDEAGEPGLEVASTVTAADGTFSLTPPLATEYWVEVVADSKVQQGYVDDGDPNYVQPNPGFAAKFFPGTALGRVWDNPSFIRGRVVDADTHEPVADLAVSLREATDLSNELASAVTNANGRFTLTGIEGEDFGLRLLGNIVEYENGWRACNGTVVHTWGAACGSPIGIIGRIRIDAL